MSGDSNAGIQNPAALKPAENDTLNEPVLDESSSQSTTIFSSIGQDMLTLGPHTRMLGPDCRERCIEGSFNFFPWFTSILNTGYASSSDAENKADKPS
jgi:hypothetical protein